MTQSPKASINPFWEEETAFTRKGRMAIIAGKKNTE